MPVIESCFNNNNKTMRTIFFCELAHLLRYWRKNSDSPDYPVYNQMMKIYWYELTNIFNRLIDDTSESSTKSDIVSSMAELLQYLKTAPCHGRRNMKVKFLDTSESQSSIQSSSLKIIQSVEEKNTETVAFLNELQQFIVKICVGYFKRINENPLVHKIADLIKILSVHESKEIFEELAKTFDSNTNLLQFYNKNLKILLNGNDKEALISLIFSMMLYMLDTEKREVLYSFNDVIIFVSFTYFC